MSFWSRALILLSGLHKKWTDNKINFQDRQSAAMLPGQPFKTDGQLLCYQASLSTRTE